MVSHTRKNHGTIKNQKKGGARKSNKNVLKKSDSSSHMSVGTSPSANVGVKRGQSFDNSGINKKVGLDRARSGQFLCPKCGEDLYNETRYKQHLFNQHGIDTSPISPESDYDESKNPALQINDLHELFEPEQWEKMEYNRIMSQIFITHKKLEYYLHMYKKSNAPAKEKERFLKALKSKREYLIELLDHFQDPEGVKDTNKIEIKMIDRKYIEEMYEYADMISVSLELFEEDKKNAKKRADIAEAKKRELEIKHMEKQQQQQKKQQKEKEEKIIRDAEEKLRERTLRNQQLRAELAASREKEKEKESSTKKTKENSK